MVRVDQDLDAQVVGSSDLARSGASMSRGRGWAQRCACWCLGEGVVLGAVRCRAPLGCVGDEVVLRYICVRVGFGERVRAGVLCLRVCGLCGKFGEEREVRCRCGWVLRGRSVVHVQTNQNFFGLFSSWNALWGLAVWGSPRVYGTMTLSPTSVAPCRPWARLGSYLDRCLRASEFRSIYCTSY